MWPHGIYLSNVTFGNKTHFVCLQPELCCVQIYALGRSFDILQKLTARARVRGSGRGLTWLRRWIAHAGTDGRTETEPGTDICRRQVINIVRAALIPGQESQMWREKLMFCVAFVRRVSIIGHRTAVAQKKLSKETFCGSSRTVFFSFKWTKNILSNPTRWRWAQYDMHWCQINWPPSGVLWFIVISLLKHTGDTLVNLPLPRQQKIEHTCQHAACSHLPCTCTQCTIHRALGDHTGNLGMMIKRLAVMNKTIWLALWFVALMIATLSSTSSVWHVHTFHPFLIPIWIKWVSGIMWLRVLKESGSLRLEVFGTVLRSCCSSEKPSLICGSLTSAAFRGILQLNQNSDFVHVGKTTQILRNDNVWNPKICSHSPSLVPYLPNKSGGSEVISHFEALPGGTLYPTMISWTGMKRRDEHPSSS